MCSIVGTSEGGDESGKNLKVRSNSYLYMHLMIIFNLSNNHSIPNPVLVAFLAVVVTAIVCCLLFIAPVFDSP